MKLDLAVAISPDGKRLAGLDSDGSLRLWELVDGKLKGQEPKDTFVIENGRSQDGAIGFSPNSKYLAASAQNGQVVVWNATSGKRLRDWPVPGEVHGVAFAPDSRHLAIATGNGTVYLLRLAPPPGTNRPDTAPTP